MVDAMLAMQSRQVEDARTLGSIEQLRDRVHALAVVHAQLMASPDLRTFDAAQFLRALTACLPASISSRVRSSSLTRAGAPIPLPLDMAPPLGLPLTKPLTQQA